jgi:Tfp pilus assembly protein PilF
VAKRKRAAAAETLPPPKTSRTLPIAVALVALTLFVYWGVQRFEFINWDDPSYLTENTNVQAGLSASNVWWALTTGHSPYWHPLTWLSHMLDVTLYGMDPGPHHVTNLVIHIASTLLLFVLLRRMTGDEGPSAFVAALFAVHPLHVESVAWLAERKDVLSSFFLLVSIWTYVRYVEHPGAGRYVAVAGAYALALMSKPMVVTLPFALLLLDVWPLRRFGGSEAGPEDPGYSRRADPVYGRRADPPYGSRAGFQACLIEKVPLLAMALGTSVATFIVQTQVGAVAALSVLSVPLRIKNALIGYLAYLGATIWPARLAAFYPLRDIAAWEVIAAAASLVTLTVLAWTLRRRHPYVVVGWLWYVITVAPVIGLMQAGEQARADRFMYVPIVGLFVIAAWGGRAMLRRAALPPRGVAAVAVGLVAIAAWTARAQAATWSDSITLWRHAAAVTDNNYIAYEKMAEAQREGGRLAEAEANYRHALTLAPAHSPGYEATIHNSVGMVLEREGQAAEARQHFAEAVRLSPGFAEAQINLANALASSGALADAVPHYQAAIALNPEYTEPRVGLGAVLLRLNKPAEAVGQYRDAVRLDASLAEAHNGLGAALAMQEQNDAAMAEYQDALRLKPLPSAHLNIALLLIKQGDVAEARRHLETALTIDPTYTPARQALQIIEERSR